MATPVPAYDLQAIDVVTGAHIEQFNSPPVLTVAGSDAGSQVYYLNPTSGPQAINSSYDSTTGAVSAGLPHFSTYAVLSGIWNIVLSGSSTEDLTLRVDNNQLDAVEDGTTVQTTPLAGLTAVTITSPGASATNLTLDIGGGQLPVAIIFEPSGGANALSIPTLSGDSSWSWTGRR